AITGEAWVWVVDVFIVVSITLFAAFVIGLFIDKLKEKASHTKTLWDDALFESISRPAKWFVWVMGLSSAAEIAGAQTDSVIFQSVGSIRQILAIVIVTWFINGFIRRVEENLVSGEFTSKPMDKTTAVA